MKMEELKDVPEFHLRHYCKKKISRRSVAVQGRVWSWFSRLFFFFADIFDLDSERVAGECWCTTTPPTSEVKHRAAGAESTAATRAPAQTMVDIRHDKKNAVGFLANWKKLGTATLAETLRNLKGCTR